MTQRRRVLVIDDDRTFRTQIHAMLRGEFIVAVACDGREGFAKALAVKPDLAIVDIQMPVWDGFQTLKAFRSHASLKDIPVLMLTGDASKDAVMKAVAGGANDYILKASFSRASLLKRITTLLRGGRAQAPQPLSADRIAMQGAPTATPRTHAPTITPADPEPEPVAIAATPSSEERLQTLIDDWE